jgi:manganese/zinc/iron transport system substrate-binding protein
MKSTHHFKTFFAVLIVFYTLINTASAEKLRVLCTTNLVADLAKEIGQNLFQVESLMGPGVDPHLYRATQGDVKRIQEADLILYNGLHLEGKMHELLEKLSTRKKVHAVSANIEPQKLRRPPDFEGGYDPHIWFDVSLWKQAAQTTAAALIELQPSETAAIEAQAQAFYAKLDELHRWIHATVGSIPAERRILITAHDAFGYFGQAYAVQVVGLQGISTAAEYGLRDVIRVVDLIVAQKVPAVFVETSVSRRFVNTLQEGVAAKGHTVSLGGELYSDALGSADSPAATYIGMMRHNVTTIVEALK